MKTILLFFFAAALIYPQDIKLGFELTFTGNNVLFVNGAEGKSEVEGFIKKGLNLIYYPIPILVTGLDFGEDYGVDIKAGWTILTSAEPFTLGIYPRVRLYDKIYLLGALNRHFEGEADKMTEGYYGFDGFSYGAGLSYNLTKVFSVEYIIQYAQPKDNFYKKNIYFGPGWEQRPPRTTLTKIDYIMQLGFNFKWDLL